MTKAAHLVEGIWVLSSTALSSRTAPSLPGCVSSSKFLKLFNPGESLYWAAPTVGTVISLHVSTCPQLRLHAP